MERKLAAILAADVVGYSTLMERDEEGTFQRVVAGRKELFEPTIERRHGRIFKIMGDGLLAEFGSVVDAVECAVALQRGMAERNAAMPAADRIEVRIGVNLGEVIVEGNDRYGEGVNVAARLQQLAEPGGIRVSEKVAREVERKLAFAFESTGLQQVKNIVEPVHTFRVVLAAGDLPAAAEAPLALPDRPSIAVMPFTNMGGAAEEDYFADGLVEDVITGLSKFPGIFVIARNSTFVYKGRSFDVRQVARELGVRYVLEGSVRKAAGRLRITGQLVEGADGVHVWADKFEGPLEDVFDLQDRLTESIVGAIEPTLRRAEIERARRKRPDRLDAYDFYLRALPHAYANTPHETDQALRLLGEALTRDPGYTAAHGLAAWGREQRFLRGGFDPADRDAALHHARLAMASGRDDPQALSIGAFVYGNITHDYATALSALDLALQLNRNSAIAYNFAAMVNVFAGHHGPAFEQAARALRLSPFDPLNYHAHLAQCWAHYLEDRFDQAAAQAALGLQLSPKFTVLHFSHIAALVRLGQIEQARGAAARLLEIAPDWTVTGILRMELIDAQKMARFATALREAGLPE
jgi:adenylate cyclase